MAANTFHFEALKNLCRICGNKLKKQKKETESFETLIKESNLSSIMSLEKTQVFSLVSFVIIATQKCKTSKRVKNVTYIWQSGILILPSTASHA